ncbi:metal ABC transporter solute-binding protein, Zn/Mn family, partial [Treponema sp. R6D11]
MKKIFALGMTIVLSLTFLVGCGKLNVADNGKLNIATVIFPEYDFARAVAKEHANISMLVKPGASIHSFEPSPDDIKT